MEFFEPNEYESDQRCGEIFLTSNGNITFHCTLCEMIYKNFDAYASHLSDNHLNSIESFAGSFTELDSFKNEYQKNDELKLDPLIDTTKDSKNKTKSNSDLENISSYKQYRNGNNILTRLRKNPKRRTGVNPSNELNNESKKQMDPITSTVRKTNKQKLQILSKQERSSAKKIRDCSECQKICKSTTDRLHTCERKYLCHNCGRSFLRSSELHRHLKRHRNQRDYKCKICDKAFYDRQGLKRHMEGHSTERPFKCKECLVTFSRKTALRNHVRLHENKREYKCNLCGSGFNQHAGLFTHMKLTHKAA